MTRTVYLDTAKSHVYGWLLKASGRKLENQEGPLNIYQLCKIRTFKWAAKKSILKPNHNKQMSRVCEMAQLEKRLAAKPYVLSLIPGLHSGRRDPTPTSCSLTYTHVQ